VQTINPMAAKSMSSSLTFVAPARAPTASTMWPI
jgi:hypothetical protein